MTTFAVTFNETVKTFDQVHVLFHGACARYGDQVAIECGEEQVTYSALLDRASSIRAHLRSNQLGQGAIVAVCGERSVDVIACAIAVWAAGSTLMLVDSSIPEERRNLMLAAVPTSAVMLCGADVSVGDLRVIDYRSTPPLPVDSGFENQAGDQAYIAFTSGSTGRPKAIVGSHNGLSHFLTWQRGEYVLGGEPYGFMIRKGEDALKDAVDDRLTALFRSDGFAALYAKWFIEPLPGLGFDLDMPMSVQMRDIA